MARLGEHALEGSSASDLMQEAVAAGVELLDLEIGAVAEYLSEREAFSFRVTHGLPGVGPGTLVPAGRASQSGYVILTGAPAVVSDWAHEQGSAALAFSPSTEPAAG